MEESISILLLYILIGSLHGAGPCRHDGSVHMCQISSNDNGTSLVSIAANQRSGKNVNINISIPFLHLTKNVTFKYLHSLTINGLQRSPTTVYCTQFEANSGIKFQSVNYLVLNDLKLKYCGSLMTIRGRNYSSALTLRYCKNVEIRNLLINKSPGTGLSIINHQKGKVNIFNTNFTENEIPQEYKGRIYGGGGVYIYKGFDYHWRPHMKISITFEHCIFSKNVAYTRQYQSFYTDEFGEDRSGYGRGGGVYLMFERNATMYSKVQVSFSQCTFTKNQAFLGGGLSVIIGGGRNHQLNTTITVTVTDSVFDSNGCNTTRIGGGIHLTYNLHYKSVPMIYKLQNVKLTRNCAELGGGFFFFSNIWKYPSKHSLRMDNCTFEGNKAHTGSAIDMSPNSFTRFSVGRTTIVPVFKDCKFMYNEVFPNSGLNGMQRIAGIGTLYASLYHVKFEGKNQFEHNIGTAIHLVNGNADFIDSSVVFKNNQGIRGGALALIGLSSIYVGPERDYLFVNNSALYQGGGIFALMIDTHDFTLSKSCFIQYHNGSRFIQAKSWNNNITFNGNEAPFGPDIFATSLHPCQLVQEDRRYQIVSASQVFSIRGIHVNESKVATEGAQLHRGHDIDVLYAVPGKQHNHGVTIRDDISHQVMAPLRAQITTGNVKLDPVLSSYVGEKIQLIGKPGERSNLSLQTVSTRQINTTFIVQLEDCPPGFKLDDKGKCVCNANEYFGLADCDNDNFHTYLTPGLWAGLIDNKEMVTSVCPRRFCDYGQLYKDDQTRAFKIMLPQRSSDLDKTICGDTRTGILCGSCRSRYSVHFHSPNYLCKPTNRTLCRLGWLFYILSEVVPVTVVFVTVIVLNISFTSGAINGFILFSQVLLSFNIDASGIIIFPQKRSIMEGYQFLYGFLNLDFFTTDTLSFCLWPNATALDMLAFKYITIVYALSLMILVIWFMNKFGGSCFRKCCRITTIKSSVIRGISAFLIICYSQSVLVSHRLVNGADLWRKESSNTTIAKRVWFDGNMIYLSRSHLPYALPALLCLLTIGILPPILLMAYPLINKVLAFFGIEEYRPVTIISQKLPITRSLKPLLDCFQGCFRDGVRFFAGLYFLYRWMAPIVYTLASSLGSAYVITEIFLILILAIHAFSQPYIWRVHNMIDTILFTDLLLINSITCIHYFLFQSQELKSTVSKIVATTAKIQATLIYLPLIAVMVYVMLLVAKQVYSFWYRKYRHQRTLEEPALPLQTLGRLKAVVHSSFFADGNLIEQELPDRLLTENVTYEEFEDTY